jgi:hypothetical protein
MEKQPEAKKSYYTDANKKAIKKYQTSEHGKAKLREAKRRYYLKKKAQEEEKANMFHEYMANDKIPEPDDVEPKTQ